MIEAALEVEVEQYGELFELRAHRDATGGTPRSCATVVGRSER